MILKYVNLICVVQASHFYVRVGLYFNLFARLEQNKRTLMLFSFSILLCFYSLLSLNLFKSYFPCLSLIFK